jgi:aryl sulfotransferase
MVVQTPQPAAAATPRIVQNHTLDSTRWHDFVFRERDIIIASWAKAGTTWLQHIVNQLVLGGVGRIPLSDVSPWIENRLYSRKQMYRRLALQTHRRFVKTHLPADALPWSELARYVCICRDGRDVAWSWYHHHRSLLPGIYEIINGLGGRVGPPFERPVEPFNEFFRLWLERDGYPLWPFWSHVRSWWDVRERENVLLVRFEDLKADLSAEVGRLARFLAPDAETPDLGQIVERSSFEYMKEHAATLLRPFETAMSGGAGTFMRQGSISGWRGSISAENLKLYEDCARRSLEPACLDWLHS